MRFNSPPAKMEAGKSTKPVTKMNTAESESIFNVSVAANPGNDQSGWLKVLPPSNAFAPASTNASRARQPSHASTFPCRDTRRRSDSRMPAPHSAKKIEMSVGVSIYALHRIAFTPPMYAGGLASDRDKQAVQNCQRRRRVSGHFHVHRQHVRHAFGADKTFREHAAGQRARADGHDPFGRGHGVVNFFQREPHVIRHRADHQQHVGVTRRGRDEKSQPVHVVIRIVELLDFIEARAAIARVHDDDVNGTLEGWPKFILAARGQSPIRSLLPIHRMLDAANAAIAMNAAANIRDHRRRPG